MRLGQVPEQRAPTYLPKAKVTAMEPDNDLRAAAEEAAKISAAEIRVLPRVGEQLPFEDATFDAVSASQVLCSVTSPSKTLEELKRVLRPGGKIRLMEHFRSEHWLAGRLMSLLNLIWLQINKVGWNWNRKTVEEVQKAGFKIRSVEAYKIYSKVVPATFPGRIIKGERPM